MTVEDRLPHGEFVWRKSLGNPAVGVTDASFIRSQHLDAQLLRRGRTKKPYLDGNCTFLGNVNSSFC